MPAAAPDHMGRLVGTRNGTFRTAACSVMTARLDDKLRDVETIRQLRIEVEQLRQQLAGIQPQKLQPAPRARHKPTTLTWGETAAFAFRLSETWLRRNIDTLPDFPRPHKLFGRFSTEEVERWVHDMFQQTP
jgi:hypothetical protein